MLEYEPRGQILASTTGSLLEALVLLCRFFPGKIMVIAESRQEMHRLTHRLRRRLNEPVVCITKGLTLSESRIEVGTVGSLDLMCADVVILARANQALQAKTRTRPGLLAADSESTVCDWSPSKRACGRTCSSRESLAPYSPTSGPSGSDHARSRCFWLTGVVGVHLTADSGWNGNVMRSGRIPIETTRSLASHGP